MKQICGQNTLDKSCQPGLTRFKLTKLLRITKTFFSLTFGAFNDEAGISFKGDADAPTWWPVTDDAETPTWSMTHGCVELVMVACRTIRASRGDDVRIEVGAGLKITLNLIS